MLIVKCGDQELQNPALSIASGGSSGVLPRAHSTRHFYNNHNTEKNNPGSEEGPESQEAIDLKQNRIEATFFGQGARTYISTIFSVPSGPDV